MKAKVYNLVTAIFISLGGHAAPGGNPLSPGGCHLDSVVVYAESVTAQTGSMVTLHVRSVNFAGIVSCQGSVSWDTSVVGFDSLVLTGLPGMGAGNFGLGQAGAGVLTFSWNDPTLQGVSLADSAPLFGIRFGVHGVPGTQSPVGFPNQPLALELVDTSFYPVAAGAVAGEIAIPDTSVGMGHDASPARPFSLYPHPLQAGQTVFALRKGDGVGEVESIVLMNIFGMSMPCETLEWVDLRDHIQCRLQTPLANGYWLLGLKTSGESYWVKLKINE